MPQQVWALWHFDKLWKNNKKQKDVESRATWARAKKNWNYWTHKIRNFCADFLKMHFVAPARRGRWKRFSPLFSAWRYGLIEIFDVDGLLFRGWGFFVERYWNWKGSFSSKISRNAWNLKPSELFKINFGTKKKGKSFRNHFIFKTKLYFFYRNIS